MDKFQEMRTFAAVIDAGSFVGAADILEMSKPAVSRYVADLEARLGVRLLHRTTRRLSLTDEGEIFYARCQELLAGLDEAEAEISSRSSEATGVLKINAPLSFGILQLADLWSEFAARNPKVKLDITLADRVVDLVEEGYDLAIRIATLPSSTLISRQLASTRMVLCAAPAYLQRAGTPAHPSELAKHTVLTYSYWSTNDVWQFTGPDGEVVVKIQPVLTTNNGDTCRAAALQGFGIILQPSFIVGNDLVSGALVEVLPEYRSIELGVYAVYPTRRYVAPKVRAMIDFLREAFHAPRWPA